MFAVNPEQVVIQAPVGTGFHRVLDLLAVCYQVGQLLRIFLGVYSEVVIPRGAPFSFCHWSLFVRDEVEGWRVVIKVV